MKWIHPKLSHAATFVAIAISCGAGGCRNQSGGAVNPFLAPDRVPPPATRSLLPGQAQPYYPGDPLPVMQSGTAQPADGATFAAAEPSQMPSADTNLAWNSPSSPPSSPPSTQVQREPQTIASAELSVAIPADGDSLRFALPSPPEPQPFMPVAPAPLATSQQSGQIATTPPTQVVLPASYSAPVSGSAEPAVTSPWRVPQVAEANAWSANGVQPIIVPPPPIAQPIASAAPPSSPMASMPLVTTASSMDVRLRAVPSPPPETVLPTMPRIRLPGYASAQPLIGSNDGFRPRTSMR